MTLTTTLYRDILKKAKKFDKYPVLKVRISPPLLEKVFEKKAEERQSLVGTPSIPNYFYTPHSFGGDTFYNTFRAYFREGVYSNSATGVANAFSIIRDLNNTLAIAAKPKREEHKLPKPAAIPRSALTNPLSSPPLSSLSSLSSSPLSSLASSSSPRPNVEFIFVGPGGQKLDKKQLTVDEKTLAELEKGLKNMMEVVKEEEIEEEEEEEEEGEQERGKDKAEDNKDEDEKQRKDVQEVVKKMLLEFEQKDLAVKTATILQTQIEKETEKEKEEEKKKIEEKVNLWVKPSNIIQPGTILITQPSHDYDSGRFLSCFYRSVVLVCGSTSQATVGLILNKPLERDEAIEKYKLFALPQSKEYKKHGLATMPSSLEKANWFMGGPVDAKPPHAINLSNFGTFSSLYLSSSPLIPDAKPLLDNIHCGGSIYKLMNAVENNEIEMERVRMFMGCSLWSKGQLEEEINKGWWVQAEASEDFYPSFVQAAKSIGHPEPLSNLDISRVPYCTLQMLNLK